MSDADGNPPTQPQGPSDAMHQLERFEAAWQRGAPPDLDAFLGESCSATDSDSVERRQGLLHELVMLDLEYRWQRPAPAEIGVSPLKTELVGLFAIGRGGICNAREPSPSRAPGSKLVARDEGKQGNEGVHQHDGR